ncbi:sodium-dependent transporter [Acidobacteriota bacterium]
MSAEETNGRGQWKSTLGFILAASGSAIGLGNIVFFPARAYEFGGGAFYLPYFIALFLVGIPIMILEFGLGHQTRKAFPLALGTIAGKPGEFGGWWAILNATVITMYYVTILAWVVGMLFGSLGQLWEPTTDLPAFEPVNPSVYENPGGFFYNMLSSYKALLFVLFVWVANAAIVWRGARSIESAVRIFVPLMWLFMIILIIRGLTLENGSHGVMFLFNPNFEVMKDIKVWQGAFSQIFFTLSLGFGIMCAYASYLPKRSDVTNNALMTSCMNCGFEYIAGLAIFSLLFAFALVPQASTLSMMFFVVPKGIANFPAGAEFFGILFFVLLLLAGLSSSVSLVEAITSSIIDKFGAKRSTVVVAVTILGCVGSMFFAIPTVIDKGLNATGTVGLTLLDLMDHWVFYYGLMMAGLMQCLIIGWGYGAKKLRENINKRSKFRLPSWIDWQWKLVIPIILAAILIYSAVDEKGMYGANSPVEFGKALSWTCFFVWIVGIAIIAAVLTLIPGKKE